MTKDTTFVADKKARQEARKEDKLRQKQLARQRARIHNEMIAYEKKHAKEKKTAPKGSFISLKHINKIYPNHVQAVFDFNLDIKEHEFIVLVGPSGCGKSTTLRMIAGLEDITAGDLYIDGVYANDLHPKNRGIAMVFQSYALYPHMTVAGNMSFSLKIRRFPTLITDKEGKPILGINKRIIKNLTLSRKNLKEYLDANRESLPEEQIQELEQDIADFDKKIEYYKTTPVECYRMAHLPKEEIRERVLNAADILQIRDYLSRKPKALSGGQCQRVALGRAIVRNAKVFLMDEPLSNLDAKLRVTMRSEIIKLHESLHATTIYVTHDQTEAMTMATRIVVMNKGYVQQIASPIEVYNHPANMFVATFIGSPSMNLIQATYRDGKLLFKEGFELPLPKANQKAIENYYQNALALNQERLEAFDHDFAERNEMLQKIKEAEEKQDAQAIEKYRHELGVVESASAERNRLLEYIKKYGELDLKEGIPVVFGVRPEDIVKASDAASDGVYSSSISFRVDVAELLGHEYYAHGNFQGSEIVAKIQSKRLIGVGDEMDVAFDMERIHVFDTISEETIV